jgi:hypothetical protein
MSLDLKNTTLLFVETRAHEITTRVLKDCIKKVNFGRVLVYTDKPDLIDVPGVDFLPCIDFPNKKDAGRFYYSSAMANVETDFALLLEWDGGIFKAENWRPEFLNYDYVGAPWVVRAGDTFDVGNGGFTLMSKRLGHFLCENTHRYPVATDWDVCRTQRQHLETEHGFKWPNRQLAGLFSWELAPRDHNHFGYHGAFTWPEVLPREEVFERARLMVKNRYLTTKAAQLFQRAPWVLDGLPTEEIVSYYNSIPPGRALKPRIPGVMSSQQRAAMMLVEAQRRGFITHAQKHVQTGEKA